MPGRKAWFPPGGFPSSFCAPKTPSAGREKEDVRERGWERDPVGAPRRKCGPGPGWGQAGVGSVPAGPQHRAREF